MKWHRQSRLPYEVRAIVLDVQPRVVGTDKPMTYGGFAGKVPTHQTYSAGPHKLRSIRALFAGLLLLFMVLGVIR